VKRKLNFKNLIILVLSIIFIVGFIRQMNAINRLNEEYQSKQNYLKELEEDNARLRELSDKVQSGEYGEQLARERLNMNKAGEWSVINKQSEGNSQN